MRLYENDDNNLTIKQMQNELKQGFIYMGATSQEPYMVKEDAEGHICLMYKNTIGQWIFIRHLSATEAQNRFSRRLPDAEATKYLNEEE